MKFFACVVLAAFLAVACAEGEREARSSYGGHAAASYAPAHAGPAHTYTYPSQVASVPCAKNLLFSCSPSVAPVPCHAAPHYAHAAPAHYGAPSYSVGAAHDEGKKEMY